MRLSWCRERAISPYRPQQTELALRQTQRGQRQSSHWLHRFREAKPVKWKMPRLISQIRSKCWVLSCLRADCLVICGSDFVVRKQPWDYAVCFPKTLGKFLRIWAWLIRRDVLLQHFTGVCFHLVEWITAGCIWDYYYKLCKWTNQPLKTAFLFRINRKCLVLKIIQQ